MVALDLVPAVPEPVRILYDRLVRLFRYGLWAYDLFTLLDQNAYLVLETALQYRFVEFYHGIVPLIYPKSGTMETLGVTHYSEVEAALRARGAFAHKDGWQLVGHERFNASYDSAPTLGPG